MLINKDDKFINKGVDNFCKHTMLKRFVLMGGFDIDDTDNTDGQSETKNEH